MSKWLDPVEIVSVVQFSQEGDALLWAYESSRIYSTHSIYAIINFRGGVQPVYIPCVWKIKAPPRVLVFLAPIKQ